MSMDTWAALWVVTLWVSAGAFSAVTVYVAMRAFKGLQQ